MFSCKRTVTLARIISNNGHVEENPYACHSLLNNVIDFSQRDPIGRNTCQFLRIKTVTVTCEISYDNYV